MFNIISPLSFMLGYVAIGMISSLFSPRQTSICLWWGLMFLSPILVLLVVPPYMAMNLNWVIASVLSLGLMLFFLSRPGVLKGLSWRAFFSSKNRPFEGWLEVPHEAEMFGLVGSRPTGFGRYSAITSLVSLCLFVTYGGWWFLAFLFFTSILLFSKGKMEILAFLVSVGFILFASHNLLSPLILVYEIIACIAYVIIFGNISPNAPIKEIAPVNKPEKTTLSSLYKVEVPTPQQSLAWKTVTIGGRINGVWKQSLDLIKKRSLFGYGFSIEHYVLKNWEGNPTIADGTLFGTLLQTGIVGSFFFLSSIALTVIIAFNLFIAGGHSIYLLEAISVGIFILLRGITQSFSGYSADWLFLVPIIAYIQFK